MQTDNQARTESESAASITEQSVSDVVAWLRDYRDEMVSLAAEGADLGIGDEVMVPLRTLIAEINEVLKIAAEA